MLRDKGVMFNCDSLETICELLDNHQAHSEVIKVVDHFHQLVDEYSTLESSTKLYNLKLISLVSINRLHQAEELLTTMELEHRADVRSYSVFMNHFLSILDYASGRRMYHRGLPLTQSRFCLTSFFTLALHTGKPEVVISIFKELAPTVIDWDTAIAGRVLHAILAAKKNREIPRLLGWMEANSIDRDVRFNVALLRGYIALQLPVPAVQLFGQMSIPSLTRRHELFSQLFPQCLESLACTVKMLDLAEQMEYKFADLWSLNKCLELMAAQRKPQYVPRVLLALDRSDLKPSKLTYLYARDASHSDTQIAEHTEKWFVS